MNIKPSILAERIKADIDAYCVKIYTDEHRNHLGASVIGHECARFSWYAFRWVKKEIFGGRMLRLFNRGHKEEGRWIEWLRGIGFQVWEVDPATGKQFRIWGARGHFGGSTDAVGISPYPDVTEPMLLEFKTHNTKSFSNLVNKKSVKIAKPRHYSQMCSYGKHYGFRYAIYCASNKNDDDIYPEVVELDWTLADDLQFKASDIIFTQIPPNKISLQPSYFECKFCAFQGICHRGEAIEKNCRSCIACQPVEDGKWLCGKNGMVIPDEVIKVGCGVWEPIV